MVFFGRKQPVNCPSIARQLPVNCPSSVCPLHVHCMSAACPLHVRCMSAPCSRTLSSLWRIPGDCLASGRFGVVIFLGSLGVGGLNWHSGVSISVTFLLRFCYVSVTLLGCQNGKMLLVTSFEAVSLSVCQYVCLSDVLSCCYVQISSYFCIVFQS